MQYSRMIRDWETLRVCVAEKKNDQVVLFRVVV